MYSTTSDMNHITDYALGCRGTDAAAERVVRTTPLTSYSTRYDWKLHVCAVGPYGPACEKSRYAKHTMDTHVGSKSLIGHFSLNSSSLCCCRYPPSDLEPSSPDCQSQHPSM